MSAERTRSLASDHSLVRQPHDGEGGQAGRHLHLHVDGTGLDSLKGNCRDALNHTTAPGPDARISSIEARRGLLVPGVLNDQRNIREINCIGNGIAFLHKKIYYVISLGI
jgi:hypothetical protein